MWQCGVSMFSSEWTLQGSEIEDMVQKINGDKGPTRQ
jgi:hypothetical protein